MNVSCLGQLGQFFNEKPKQLAQKMGFWPEYLHLLWYGTFLGHRLTVFPCMIITVACTHIFLKNFLCRKVNIMRKCRLSVYLFVNVSVASYGA